MNRFQKTLRLLAGGMALLGATATPALGQTEVVIQSPLQTDPLTVGVASTIQILVTGLPAETPVTAVRINLNGEFLDYATEVFADNYYTYEFVPAEAGVSQIVAEVQDSTGAIHESNPSNYTVLEPVGQTEVSILAPANNSRYLPGTVLPVQVVARSPDSLISRVDFFLNGIQVGSTSEAPFRTEIALPSIGSYTLTAKAFDFAGDSAVSEEVILHAGAPDEEQPRVVIDFPLPLGDGDTVNDVSYASAMFLNATAIDPNGTIQSLEFYINGQLLGEAEHKIGDVYSLFYDPNALGNYIISAKATDNSGNVGWSVPLVLDVGPLERPLPKVKMIQPFAESIVGRVVGIFAEVDSGLIPVDRVDFFANGVLLGSVDEPTSEGLYSFNWVPEEPGTYNLQTRIVQIDPAGAVFDNWKIADPVSISIANPPAGAQPEISITHPADESFSLVLRQIMIQADALDPLGSVEEVRFYVNGKQLETVDTTFPFGTTYWPQSPGLYQFVAEMLTDRGLRVHSNPVSVTVGVTEDPSGTIELPSGQNPTAGSTIPITVNATDPDGYIKSVEIFVNGEAPHSNSVDDSAPFTIFWEPGSPGLYDIDALITDNSGNEVLISETVSVSEPVGIVPRVTMSVTGSGNVTPGSRVVVLANVYDDTPDDLAVTFFMNGSQVGQTDTEAPYSVIVDPEIGGGVFGNAYNLTALVADPDGNVRADTLDPLYISDFAVDLPSVKILNLSEGDQFTRGSRVPIRAEVRGGATSDLAHVVFYANGEEIGRLPSGEVSGRYSFDWLPEYSGSVEITAAGLLHTKFYDHDRDSGGLNPTPPIPVTPVNVAFPVNIAVNEPVGVLPSISLDVLPRRSDLAIGSKVLVYADAQDIDGQVQSVEFFSNGVSIGTDTEAPFTHLVFAIQPGNFALNALARDSDGNVVTSTVVNLDIKDRVISRTPEVNLTVPDSGQEGNYLSLRASTEGFVTEPEAVVFYVNGQKVGESQEMPYTLPWLANLEGLLTFFATAEQTLGDGSVVATVSNVQQSFLVDNLPPVIDSFTYTFPDQDPVTKPNPDANDALNFTLALSDTGAIRSVELLRDGEVVKKIVSGNSPFEITDSPPGAGTYQYSALVTDRGGLQAQSGVITVTVEQGPGGGGDPILPEITSFTSDVVGSSLVNLPITFTVEATDEGGIDRVELFQDGGLIATVFNEPFTIEFTPVEAGTYTFRARATNVQGNQVNSDNQIVINVRQPNPLGQNTDFVYQTFLDLLMRTPTLEERNFYTNRIEYGSLSRDRFIRELIDPADGQANSEYDAVRGVLLANRFLLGQWPSREQERVDVETVKDGGLVALVSSLMPMFEVRYAEATGKPVVPDIFSSDGDIGTYVSHLFRLKYGESPNSAQLNLAKLHFRASGRDAYTASFIADVEVIATSNSYITTGLGFTFSGSNPPDDTYLREADAATLLINLLRVVPSDAEVAELSQKLFATQVAQILADPRYAARFATVFATLQHYPQNWKYSEWFGWFNTAHQPWIYHTEQGWISFRTTGQSKENFWYWDAALGWMWTREDMFPILYNESNGAWLLTPRLPYSATEGRWFFNFNDQSWLKR